jgi:TonB family protein
MKSLAVLLLAWVLIGGSVAVAGPTGKAIAVHTVAPKYGRGLPEGKGRFRLTLDGTGRVLRVAVLKSSGYRQLDASAVAALKQWRFKPLPENYVVMPVDFRQKGQERGMRVDYQ